eukprot:TRINITY_DN3832_c0_g1_i1.p1 TRINITY_DN3832_c0_g1~~TRINITY_DN3832_c0_g1_i1.p1  ORF type:complete len:283 (-),score=-11.80 TRINITY_DN3832_c0_g1_i1:347-1195(-)
MSMLPVSGQILIKNTCRMFITNFVCVCDQGVEVASTKSSYVVQIYVLLLALLQFDKESYVDCQRGVQSLDRRESPFFGVYFFVDVCFDITTKTKRTFFQFFFFIWVMQVICEICHKQSQEQQQVIVSIGKDQGGLVFNFSILVQYLKQYLLLVVLLILISCIQHIVLVIISSLAFHELDIVNFFIVNFYVNLFPKNFSRFFQQLQACFIFYVRLLYLFFKLFINLALTQYTTVVSQLVLFGINTVSISFIVFCVTISAICIHDNQFIDDIKDILYIFIQVTY